MRSYLFIGIGWNNLFILKKKSYYEKPSKVKREKRNLAKLRASYNQEKQKN